MEEEENSPCKLIDRLPVELLTEIIARANLKDASKIGSLSKAWRNLWQQYKYMDFGRCGNDQEVEDLLEACGGLSKICSFYVIAHPEQQVITRYHSWFGFALSRHVESLYINSTRIFPTYAPPASLYTSPSLVDLTLARVNLVLPDMIRLESLRSLSLYDLDLQEDDIQAFTLGCPHLRSVHLQDCNTSSTNFRIFVQNSNVRTLILGYDSQSCPSIHFTAIFLEFLEIRGWILSSLTGGGRFIKMAQVHLNPHHICCSTHTLRQAWQTFRPIAFTLQPAKIRISWPYIEKISLLGRGEGLSMETSDATCLQLDTKWNFKGVLGCAFIIQAHPVLDHLIFCLNNEPQDLADSYMFTHLGNVMRRWSIKTSEVDGFHLLADQKGGIELLKTVISRGPALEALIVRSSDTALGGPMLMEQLRSVPSASPSLQIRFV